VLDIEDMDCITKRIIVIK